MTMVTRVELSLFSCLQWRSGIVFYDLSMSCSSFMHFMWYTFVVFRKNEHLLQMVLQNWLCSPYVSYIGLWPLSSALFDLTVVLLVLFAFMSCILCYFGFCVYHAVIVLAACSDAYFINISGIIILSRQRKGMWLASKNR